MGIQMKKRMLMPVVVFSLSFVRPCREVICASMCQHILAPILALRMLNRMELKTQWFIHRGITYLLTYILCVYIYMHVYMYVDTHACIAKSLLSHL